MSSKRIPGIGKSGYCFRDERREVVRVSSSSTRSGERDMVAGMVAGVVGRKEGGRGGW